MTGWLNGSTAWGRPVDMAVDPQGDMLISDNESGTIYKLTYTAPPPPPTNQPPVADFTYSCGPSPAGEFRCVFDGSTSSDPDGTVATWSWSSPGKPNRTGVTAVWGFAFAGTYSVSLTVTDNNGAPNTKTVNVIVQ